MTHIAGTEEAGRGPVVGGMAVALVTASDEAIDTLEQEGIVDSKELIPQRREHYAMTISKHCNVQYHIIPPERIDEAITSPDSNLNWLTADVMASLIQQANADTVVVDCPSPNINAFKAYLADRVNTELNVAHKADRDYTIVSAASIIAKVERDNHIRQLEQKYDANIGSGYPSDPQTQAFLDEHYDDYDCFRTSWTTWQQRKHEDEQQALDTYSKS